MKKFILDTSFIVSCVRNKIDFFYSLIGEKIIIPIQVIEEIKRLKSDEAKVALKVLEANKFEEVDLGKGHVDKLIIRFAKKDSEVIVGTLDREIKKKVKNQKLVIRGKKKLEII